MVYYIVAFVALIADQLSKWWIVDNMRVGESRSVIGEFFHIASHRNRGAAFGILQEQLWIFYIVAAVVCIGIVIYLRKVIRERRHLLGVALGLLLGGALGNLIDRVRLGEVVDFFKFRFQFSFFGTPVDYTFAIFNVADIAISVGVALMMLDMLLEWRKERREVRGSDA